MRRSAFARSALLTLLLAGTPLACADESVLAPPDGVTCTRGSIAPGDERAGAVNDESCLLYSAYFNWETYAESWTLRAKANTAYVVRLQRADGEEDFAGELVAYVRTPAGDATFATAAGFAIGEDDEGREMFLVNDRERTVSIRVEVPSYYGYFGEYVLTVESCPVRVFRGEDDEEAIEDLELADGCRSLGFDPRHETVVRFVSFPARLYRSYEISAARTAGDAPLVLQLFGPGLDLAGTTSGSIWYQSPLDVAEYAFELNLSVAGRYTLAIGADPDDDATVAAELLQGPAPVLLQNAGTIR